jgi:hypothetical protein
MIVYISIGNSDDKLTQQEWSRFWVDVAGQVVSMAKETHGAWFSNPVGGYQNACWCVEFSTDETEAAARTEAAALSDKYGQDSIAWAIVAKTLFV